MEKQEIIADVILDLYEMRVSSMHRYQDKYEKIQDCFKYSFFTAAIANLCDKYSITVDLLEEANRRRAIYEKTTQEIYK